ncbi:probable E3 ubiquitin-protein ligase rbrA isoform X1 [Arabidopsis lyrata subsp. lyrata]|uniref:probable E3 ubiquitin-protein ligase rbrA isoform X1 n=1 Tax=Arabidopsis lyrata subsp. lyrata TaxID=81972 RepID=UPI000A29A8CB|nr:probable E3 ubiquitin-protein ligase rbrA isoform X1 [Arabidopsis lyrata subsp. lyrata]|eukprot:XP_020883106.1 probable E3 ubiquitin-protein ligase rbrA isoform X1 [Arabidopsis lyrata subsp. lyrata]
MERHDQDLSYKKRRLDSTITGDFPNPKGEGSSAVAKFVDNVFYRLYFKGLVNDEAVSEGVERTVKAGFGVAICDEKDNLVYQIKESLRDIEISRIGVEIMALIRGLSESFDLGMRRVVIYCDDDWIYQSIIGRGKSKKKIDHLVEEVQCILEEMACNDAVLVARNDVKSAFRLARESINSSSVDVKAEQGENCVICFEETDAERMFFTNECIHRHCFTCVKQHVKVKLLSGTVPTCLDYGCKFELTLESCSKVLTPKLIEMWKQKMKEDSIPAVERIYCPYPNCSTLMSKTERSKSTDEGSNQSNVRTCVKCNGLFCIDCKVPSYSDLSCADYKKLHPDPLVDDLKLKSLANDKMWRQCVKCRHMIELSHGCNHMTCRCGYEFCYQCGIEWKKDQQICPSGCLQTGHGDYDDEDSNDDDSEHDCEEDMCDCYYDEDGVRWIDWEDFVDHQTAHYDAPMDDQDVVYKYPSPEQLFSEEGNADGNDDNWDDYNNYGGLTDSGDEGGFNEDFFRDYYSL